jgi:hypothetical protein
MKTKYTAAIVLMGTILLALTACGVTGTGGGDPLDGTSWVLPGVSATATFEDGQVHGSGGCNTYSGAYEVRGDSITIGPLAMTEMACMEPEGIMEQESLFMAHMSDAQTFALTDGQLQIFQSDGEALTFVPR